MFIYLFVGGFAASVQVSSWHSSNGAFTLLVDKGAASLHRNVEAVYIPRKKTPHTSWDVQCLAPLIP